MKPGERVTAIKEIADALERSDWPDIDLTLQEFGLPWMEDWSGSKRSYIVEMVKGEPEEKIAALHVFVSGAGSTEVRSETLPWKGPLFRLFGSHSSLDKELVSEVK